MRVLHEGVYLIISGRNDRHALTKMSGGRGTGRSGDGDMEGGWGWMGRGLGVDAKREDVELCTAV